MIKVFSTTIVAVDDANDAKEVFAKRLAGFAVLYAVDVDVVKDSET
jgi:hypothetical protein